MTTDRKGPVDRRPGRPPLPARRSLLRAMAGGLAASGVALPWLATRAQDGDAFPSRPIVLWVPWPPGGGTDLSMRVLADAASHHFKQRVIIENRPGAGGTLAMPVLQQALPDGYTVAQMPQTVFRAPYTQKVLWDPIRDVTPILQISGTTFGIVVAADSPIQSMDDLIKQARSAERGMTVATNGVGTTPHVVIDEILTKRGIRYVHVPYKGVAEQMLGVASSQVQVGVGSTGFAPYVDNGKLRLLVTFGEHRSKRWPQVPTLTELGYGIVANSPYGLAGPRGLPPVVVKALHDGFRAAMQDPHYLGELEKVDQEPAYLGTAAYAEACREAYAAERYTVERMGLQHRTGG